MAIYHMQAKVVSRGSGRSAVAASAYMSCSRMYNDYDGIQHDYTRKQGLIYQEVMLPPNCIKLLPPLYIYNRRFSVCFFKILPSLVLRTPVFKAILVSSIALSKSSILPS